MRTDMLVLWLSSEACNEHPGEDFSPVKAKEQALLANLVFGQKHVWNTAADLVDMLAVWADHLTFNDVDLKTAVN